MGTDLEIAVSYESLTLELWPLVQAELRVSKVIRIDKVFAVYPDGCVFVISDCSLLITSSLDSLTRCLSVAVDFNFTEEDWVGGRANHELCIECRLLNREWSIVIDRLWVFFLGFYRGRIKLFHGG